MIDVRTRAQGVSAAGDGGKPWCLETGGMPQPHASMLIWVESDAELARGTSAKQQRSIIVVAHGSGQATMSGSFIISYPVTTDDHGQHLPTVSLQLETMGWSVLALRRGRTDGGDLNTVVLVSTVNFGSEQRLWLAEPVSTMHDWSAPSPALVIGPASALRGGEFRAQQMRDQIEAWGNEGGASDDVAL